MPEVNIADGDVVTGADFDSIDDQLIITCTSSTRPTGVEGRHIYETDTNKRYVHNGSGWNLDGGNGWTTFTPSWTNLTIGNGTQSGSYRYMAGGMWVRGATTFGTTTSISGVPEMSLPNSETSLLALNSHIGFGTFSDTGTANYPCFLRMSQTDSTRVAFMTISASGSYAVEANTSSTVPFTWTTSDVIHFSFFVPL